MKRCLLVLVLCAGCGTGSAPTARPSATASPGGPPRQVQAVIHTDHGPSELLVGKAAMFVGAHRGGSLQRIDPATNRVTATLPIGGQLELEASTSLGGLPSVDESVTSLWACSNTDGVLHQVDPRTMRVTATVPADCDGGLRTRVGSTLWAVPGQGTKPLLVIDVSTAKVVRRVPLGDAGPGWGPATSLAGQVVIGAAESTPVLRRDGTLLRRVPVSTPWLVATGGHLYRMPTDGALAELDPVTLAVRRTFAAPPHLQIDGDPRLVADGNGHLYYRPISTAVYRIDLDSGRVTPLLDLPYGEAITGMAWAFGSLWVSNFDNDTVWRIDPTA